MLGPVATGWLVAGPQDYDRALLASAAVLVAGVAFLGAAIATRRDVAA